uniref:WGS project CBMI000000000 data, contig CS3069_c002246 n=1 Tax=Fusarium clavum TaxID=2594811 RepID=A0A090MCK0_9HYPO|nr:unnamed protein product [Fusarium clavum]
MVAEVSLSGGPKALRTGRLRSSLLSIASQPASRDYDPHDPDHRGFAGLDRTRYATTTDFRKFCPPQDCLALTNTPMIDQEFRYLGQPGHYAQFLNNKTVNQVDQEVTAGGLFGVWNCIPGYVRPGTPTERPVSFLDIKTRSLYHLWLDNYAEYLPFQTSNIQVSW